MYNHPMSLRRFPALLLCLSLTLLAACDSREVEKVLKVRDVNTGWYDVGVVNGQNKLVPSVKFQLQNVTEDPIKSVQVNAVFRAVNDPRSWGDQLIRGVGTEGLAGGATGKTLVVRGPHGYTGLEARNAMLKNKEFVDVKVDLFARHGSATWAKIGEFPIERKLLTQ